MAFLSKSSVSGNGGKRQDGLKKEREVSTNYNILIISHPEPSVRGFTATLVFGARRRRASKLEVVMELACSGNLMGAHHRNLRGTGIIESRKRVCPRSAGGHG